MGLQNKGTDESAQHWVIESVGTSSYKQESKTHQAREKVAKKKNKVKGRKLSISSGDDSDEDEDDAETGVGFDPDYPDQLLNHSDDASTTGLDTEAGQPSDVSESSGGEVTSSAPEVTSSAPEVTSSVPEVTPSASEVTPSAPEVTYSAPSYDYSSYSGGGDSGGYSGGDSEVEIM